MKRIVSFILVFTLILTFVVGCSAKSNKESENTEVKTDNSETDSKTETVNKNAETSAQEVEIKVFMTLARFKEQFDEYFEQFKTKEKKEKNINVTVKLEMPHADQAEQILKARLASNDSPDLFNIHANNISTYYEAGYLDDLSDQPFVDAMFENVKQIVTYKGKVVALPMESLAWGYLYNKEIFEKYNIEPPQTLDEMKDVIDKLKGNNVTPFLLSFQEAWIPQLMMALALGGIVNSEHPDFVDKMNRGESSYREVEDVFNIIDLIMQNGTDKPFEVGGQTGCADFANGKAAMWVQGPWMTDSILKVNPNMKIGVAPLPVSNDPKGTMINLAVSTTMVLSPTTKNKEVACDLLNYILDPEDSSALFEQLKFNPVAVFHKYPIFPWVEDAMKYVSNGRAYRDLVLPQAVTDETAKLLQSYYAKQVSKEDIIEILDKTWKQSNKLSK